MGAADHTTTRVQDTMHSGAGHTGNALHSTGDTLHGAKDTAAAKLGDAGTAISNAPDQQGMASDLIRQAAGTTDSVASWLENKQPGDILGEVQRFARNNPGTFLLLAAGAGVLAGRLTRGLTAGAPDSHGAVQGSQAQRSVQPQPVAPLHQETVYAAGNDDLYSEPVVGGGAPVSTTSLPAGTAEDTPLRYEDDPYRDEDGSYRSTDGGYRSSEGRQL